MLDERDLDPDPIRQFERWFAEARDALEVPEAMALATASAEGSPSVRMVLLKACDERGFVFHTGLGSRKGRELAANSRAALLFYWRPLGRQVRVEGAVERLDGAESDAYFATRDRARQLSAVASRQSEVIESRAELERRVAELDDRYEGREVPRPPEWGGLLVAPDELEFWQHGDDRLHDRFRYRRRGGTWVVERLAP